MDRVFSGTTNNYKDTAKCLSYSISRVGNKVGKLLISRVNGIVVAN